MIILVLLIIFAIVFILALLYILGCLDTKHMLSRREKYQEHIDNLVEELFPPSAQPLSIQTPAAQAQAINEDLEYQDAKRDMVANIRTYFNQRKINAAVAKIPGPDELAPVNPSAGYEDLSFPTPPSIERLME